MIEEDPLVAFLYLLAGSGFPMHSLEGAISKAQEGITVCKNEDLHAWAKEAADRLTPMPPEEEAEEDDYVSDDDA